MSATTGCPVHAGFDPLSEEFLRDPYAVLPAVADAPVFYAPSLDYYVVTRYADIERVFLDPETFSAANAQLPLIQLPPEVGKTLLDGGHKPQPSMVSLDPPAHGRLRKPAARAFTPRRVDRDGAAHPRDRRRAARRRRPVAAVRPHRGAGVPAADADHVQLHGRAGGGLAAAQGVVRQPGEPGVGPADARGGAAPRAADGALPPLPARAGRRQGHRPRRRLRQRAAGDPRRGPRRARARGHRLDPVLAQLRRARDDEQPDRQLRPAAARGPRALGPARRAPGPDPRCRRRDPALRPVRAGVAARDHPAGEPRRRRAARGGEALPLAGGRRPRRRGLPRPGHLRPRASELAPHARVRARHPLLHRLRARAARGHAGARGAHAPLPGVCDSRRPSRRSRSTPTSPSAVPQTLAVQA